MVKCLIFSFSQKDFVDSVVLKQYQTIIKIAKSDLDEQLETPLIEDYKEKRSIKQCLDICDSALRSTRTRDSSQTHEKHPTVISSITELLPEERGRDEILRDRVKKLWEP